MHRPLKVKWRQKKRAKHYPDKSDTFTLVFMVYFLFYLILLSLHAGSSALYSVCVHLLDSLSSLIVWQNNSTLFLFNLCYLCTTALIPTHIKPLLLWPFPLICVLIKTRFRGHARILSFSSAGRHKESLSQFRHIESAVPSNGVPLVWLLSVHSQTVGRKWAGSGGMKALFKAMSPLSGYLLSNRAEAAAEVNT